jgi:hypothetical protein
MAEIGPLRVAFAGLAHSHPFADAANVIALGGEVVGVFDTARADEFASRFGGDCVSSLAQLVSLQPDVVIATPLTQYAAATLDALSAAGLNVPVFFNKVVAANALQLAAWEEALLAAPIPVGTSSVLRFAPSLAQFAATAASDEPLGLSVRVHQDAAGYRTPAREWQDDPSRGGGSLVTIGIHAWEIVDVVVPGALLTGGGGWTRTAAGSNTRSEDLGCLWARLAVGSREVPLHVVVDGGPGTGSYFVEVLTAAGRQQLMLSDRDANEGLGFAGLITELIAATNAGAAVAPWDRARVVVQNTIRSAEIARRSVPRQSLERILPLDGVLENLRFSERVGAHPSELD